MISEKNEKRLVSVVKTYCTNGFVVLVKLSPRRFLIDTSRVSISPFPL